MLLTRPLSWRVGEMACKVEYECIPTLFDGQKVFACGFGRLYYSENVYL